ncbi:hypothetical protein MXB_4 [Myxobolus squamalis]|nr:hypothetical protein MXB_4 [Myxobolus squamalis]
MSDKQVEMYLEEIIKQNPSMKMRKFNSREHKCLKKSWFIAKRSFKKNSFGDLTLFKNMNTSSDLRKIIVSNLKKIVTKEDIEVI